MSLDVQADLVKCRLGGVLACSFISLRLRLVSASGAVAQGNADLGQLEECRLGRCYSR